MKALQWQIQALGGGGGGGGEGGGGGMASSYPAMGSAPETLQIVQLKSPEPNENKFLISFISKMSMQI